MQRNASRKTHQKLPRSGPAREALREKGQFWTPGWVAGSMVAYALGRGSKTLFDPAVGAGAFFIAAKQHGTKGIVAKFLGTEVDPEALSQAFSDGLTKRDLRDVEIRDFVFDPPRASFPAIVANPPYIRHHRIAPKSKELLKAVAVRALGRRLDGRAGLHIYFLIRALEHLAEGGRLAFIMPADTAEGVFSQPLWKWITEKFRLDAVITFEPNATPFPGVDTNALIFLIQNSKPSGRFAWCRCSLRGQRSLEDWVRSGLRPASRVGLRARWRSISEALVTGLSREPVNRVASRYILCDFASVKRGIATGANSYFYLSGRQAWGIGIPEEFLAPAIGRTRDVVGDTITPENIGELDRAGRPTLLFSPDGRALGSYPMAVQRYLKEGEEKGIHLRPLVRTRRPWYKMERREAPPFLFAYLGRRNARFVRNLAGVRPLTGFLCVYPHSGEQAFLDIFWRALKDRATISNLRLVGKSYGGGAIKVEPRSLEKLPIPERYGKLLEQALRRPAQLPLPLGIPESRASSHRTRAKKRLSLLA